MNQTKYQPVWFSDEKRSRSITKMLVFDDTGVLTLGQDSLKFTGRKLKLHISRIQQISLARQRINWGMYLILNALSILYLIFLSAQLSEGFPFFIWIPILLVANLFGLVIGYNTKWVKVEYLNDDNVCLAFFADGSSFG